LYFLPRRGRAIRAITGARTGRSEAAAEAPPLPRERLKMSDAHRSQKLVLPVSPEELKAIQRAASADGFAPADVAIWVRQLIVEKAISRTGKTASRAASEEPSTGAARKPSLGLGPCRCGHTSDPDGQCDGSCVMRY